MKSFAKRSPTIQEERTPRRLKEQDQKQRRCRANWEDSGSRARKRDGMVGRTTEGSCLRLNPIRGDKGCAYRGRDRLLPWSLLLLFDALPFPSRYLLLSRGMSVRLSLCSRSFLFSLRFSHLSSQFLVFVCGCCWFLYISSSSYSSATSSEQSEQ